jgi:hypothetical protein
MRIRILNADPQTYIKADPSMHPIIQAEACFLADFRHGDVGISSGNFLQFYFNCHNGSPGNPHSEYVSGSTNLRGIGPYAPDQAELCILTDFRCGKGGSLPATFFNFILNAILAPLGPHSECISGSTNLRDIGPMHLTMQKCDFLVWEKEFLPATFFNFI